MPNFQCGDPVRYGKFDSGASGCLVRFTSQPDRLLLLTAGHVVLPTFAQQGDAIYQDDQTTIVGRLYTWTTIDGNPTTDAALIWVDPNSVDPSLGGLGVPTGMAKPFVGQVVQTAAHPLTGGNADPAVDQVSIDVAQVAVAGPGWPTAPEITYKSQVTTSTHFTKPGDSGSIVVDAQLRVVGMVVGGSDDPGDPFTMITPISALLSGDSWSGRDLELVTAFDPTAYVAPPQPAAAGPVQAPVDAAAHDEAPANAPDPGAATTAGANGLNAATMQVITTAIRLNEIGNASPYQISFAGKGNSGASFGFMQGDLNAGQQIVATTFAAVLAASNIPADKAAALTKALSGHLLQNPLSNADTTIVDDALSTLDGRALVDKMDQTILQGVCIGVSQCLQAALSSNRTVAPMSIAYMAMWINMSGAPTKLLSWLGGDVVVLGKLQVGPAPLNIDEAAMEAYLKETPYFVANSKNFNHLQQCAQAAVATNA